MTRLSTVTSLFVLPLLGCGQDRSPCAAFRGKGELTLLVKGADGSCSGGGDRTYEVDTCRWREHFEAEACDQSFALGYADLHTGECLFFSMSCATELVEDDPVIRPCWEVDERCCDPEVVLGECTSRE